MSRLGCDEIFERVLAIISVFKG